MTDVILIILLAIANAFFARPNRLQELVDECSKSARAVLRLRGDPERFLVTVQIGITLVSSTAAAFGGASIAEQIAPLLGTLPWIGAHTGGAALTLVVVGISYLSIVVGELVPKIRTSSASSMSGRGMCSRGLIRASRLARPSPRS